MIREFETGLADALGARLPAPLAGAVDAAPGRDTARVVVSVRSAEPIDADLRSIRPERVPGHPDPRRVLRLRCDVALEMRQPPAGSRADLLDALDQTLYLLGEPGFSDGTVLLPAGPADPGFLVRHLRLVRSELPATIMLQADGLFWPVGLAGGTGVAIVAARIRQALGPIRLEPARPVLMAGGPAVELSIAIDGMGTLQVDAGQVQALPFGAVVVRVVDAGGRPGAGTLSGGSDGPDGARVVALAEGAARVEYTPADAPATELLVVALETAEGQAGVELGRFPLRVQEA